METWFALAGLALLAALLELDATSAGQFMVSRPIILGGLLGAAGGDAGNGFLLGAVIEFFVMGDLPVGGVVPSNGTVAAATAALCLVPPIALDPAWCLPLGLFGGWLYRPVETRLRTLRRHLSEGADARVRAGRPPGHERAAAISLALELASVFVFLAALTPLLKLCGEWWWRWRPVREGAAFAWRAAAPLAAVAAVHFLKPKRGPAR